jgi:general secretion pathway protein D
VLSITPRVLRAIRRPELSISEFNSGTETDIGGRGAAGMLASTASAADEAPAVQAVASPMSGGGSEMTGGSTAAPAPSPALEPQPGARVAPTGPVPYAPKKGQ